ncbi:hypothetical protein GCM10007047_19010 [Cerasicoccus arenae]|uniref:Peptide methionine sulfoxide reductase MsrA n=2 Tax=Cerasicoccus arenae TaxID=424488 RepID=A0A8J3GF04_9BACT|nr:hypothetical protein GCM10007047_19010 [Cerasicoccus arenae]
MDGCDSTQMKMDKPSVKAFTSFVLSAFILLVAGCSEGTAESKAEKTMNDSEPANLSVATFGAGCFWCTEAVMQRLPGVHRVESGYMGGVVPNPTYKEVSTGTTEHAEVIQVHYDPSVITYDQLLAMFWKLHDPTQLNRQGADVGTQYRSAIFYHSDEQKEAALKSKTAAQKKFEDMIVTEITPASEFYVAEDYHQDYYEQNKNAGYCRFVITPKLDKLGLEN